jgi:hypothetical protein
MYQLIFKPRSIEMQKEAYQWYEQKQKGLGELFLTELEYHYAKLQHFPSAYTTVYKNYRQTRLKKFPYVIVFKINDTDVLVYAIFHSSRSTKQKFK